MTITTNRLVLRNWELDDATQLYEYAKREDFGLYSDVEPHSSIYESISFIKSWLNEKDYYAIYKKDENVLIGGIIIITNEFSNLTKEDDECEIAFWIAKEHKNKFCFLEEAIKAIIIRAFDALNMNSVWFEYFEEDKESKRIQEYLRFVEIEKILDIKMSPVIRKHIMYINILTKERWLNYKCQYKNEQ